MKKNITLIIFVMLLTTVFAWIPSSNIRYQSSVFLKGNFYHIWSENHDDKFVTLVQGISPYGVKKWENPLVISHELGPSNSKLKPLIAICPDSSIIVVYQKSDNSNYMNKISSEGEFLWSNPYQISAPFPNDNGSYSYHLTVLDNNDIMYFKISNDEHLNKSRYARFVYFVSSSGLYLNSSTFDTYDGYSIVKREGINAIVYCKEDSLFSMKIENNQLSNPEFITENDFDFKKALVNSSGELFVINKSIVYCLNEDNSLKWYYYFPSNVIIRNAKICADKFVVFYTSINSQDSDSSNWSEHYCFFDYEGNSSNFRFLGSSFWCTGGESIFYYEQAVSYPGYVYIMEPGRIKNYDNEHTVYFPSGIYNWQENYESHSIFAFDEYCMVTILGPVYGFQQFIYDSSLNYLSNSYISDEVYADAEEEIAIKPDIKLSQNYPNPFNPSTTISFELEKEENVELSIFNIKGQLVQTLQKGMLSKGKYSKLWDGKDNTGNLVNSGIYFIQLKTEKQKQTKKCVLVK